MKQAVRLLFNLYPGEGRKALLFAMLSLMWGIGGFGLQILSEGAFVEHLGSEALPGSYLAVALSLCLLSSILIRSLRHHPITSIFKILLVFWSGCYLLFFTYYSLFPTSAVFWYGLKILGWTAPVSLNVTFWSLADRYFDLQDGKRFFALFNATVFMGDLTGSAIVSFGLQVLDFGNVLFTFCLCLMSCLPLAFFITKKNLPLLEVDEESGDSVNKRGWKDSLFILLSSPFTLLLLGCYLIMQLVAVDCEYHYMTCFEKHFAHLGEHKLTEFIGFCNIWISLGNMLLSLLLYSRLVQKMGVNNLIVVAPLTFLMLFAVWTFAPYALPLAIFGAVAREGVLYVLDDNNLNILVTAVPHKIRSHIRISLESFFEPAGMLLTSLMLFTFPTASLKIGIITSLFSLPVAFLLRNYYPKALFENLAAASIQFGKKVSDWFVASDKREVEYHLLSHLKMGDEKSQLLALKYLLQFENQRLLLPILHHLDLLSLMGKLHAIELLNTSPFSKHPKVLEKLERWRKAYPSEALQLAVSYYYATRGLIRPERIIQDLEANTLSKRACAILALKTSPLIHQFPTFEAKAEKELLHLLHSPSLEKQLTGIEILGYDRSEQTMQTLVHLLKSPSKEIVRAAARSLSQVACKEWKTQAHPLTKILKSANDPQTRLYLLKTIEKLENPLVTYPLLSSTLHFRPNEKNYVEKMILSYGEDICPTLIHFLENEAHHERCRLLAGKILSKLKPHILRKKLPSSIEKEAKRAYFYYYHAHALKQSDSNHDLSIIENALISGYHSTVDFIIQLIGCSSQMEGSETLSRSLWSKNKKIQAQAKEAIEKLTPPKLFSFIEPLIDAEKMEQNWMHFTKFEGPPLNLSQLLDKMASSSSPTDRIVAIGMKAKMGFSDWRHLIKMRLKQEDELFEHFARELEETQSPEPILGTTP